MGIKEFAAEMARLEKATGVRILRTARVSGIRQPAGVLGVDACVERHNIGPFMTVADQIAGFARQPTRLLVVDFL